MIAGMVDSPSGRSSPGATKSMTEKGMTSSSGDAAEPDVGADEARLARALPPRGARAPPPPLRGALVTGADGLVSSLSEPTG